MNGARDFSAVLRSLRMDLPRIGSALFAALVLWFFIGQKVETTVKVRVRVDAANGEAVVPAQTLLLRAPESLVIEKFEPKEFDIELRGRREDVDRLRAQLSGVCDLAADFCGNFVRASRQLDVGSTFRFTGFRSMTSLRLAANYSIDVTVAKRGSSRVVLKPESIEVIGEGLAADASWTIAPSSVTLSGAQDVIERLTSGSAKLRVRLTRAEVAEALRAPFRFGSSLAEVADASGVIGHADFENPTQLDLRVTRTVPQRAVRLENVPIGWLNVKTAWREGVDRQDPVHISPETMWVELSVPVDFATTATPEDELRKRINLFVDMREMQFSVEAAPLPIHVEGLPAGATYKLEHERVDVEWRKSDKKEGGS